MKKDTYFIISAVVISLVASLTLSSCGSSDAEVVSINLPAPDEECCNAEETFLAYTFLNNGYLKEIVTLRDTIDNKYALRAYSRGGKLHVGYRTDENCNSGLCA